MHAAGGVSAGLFILDQESVRYGFMAHVSLSAHSIMTGGVRVTWDQVAARAGQGGDTQHWSAAQLILSVYADNNGIYTEYL